MRFERLTKCAHLLYLLMEFMRLGLGGKKSVKEISGPLFYEMVPNSNAFPMEISKKLLLTFLENLARGFWSSMVEFGGGHVYFKNCREFRADGELWPGKHS